MKELTLKDDIRLMPPQILEAWLMRYTFIIETKGLVHAEAKSLYESMEDKKKIVLSDSSPLEGSESFKEKEAYKSPSYKTYIEGLAEARKRANKAYIEYSAAKDRFEALRSILSNRKTEMQKGIM